MKKIFIINGPNLNMLGTREPEIYGHLSLADIEVMCREKANEYGYEVDFRQSNHEGEIIEWIQNARERVDAVVINAAGYTHSSVAIHDALKLLECPVIEVHLSNPKEREAFRHVSLIEPVASAVFAGHGAESYTMAIEKLSEVFG